MLISLPFHLNNEEHYVYFDIKANTFQGVTCRISLGASGYLTLNSAWWLGPSLLQSFPCDLIHLCCEVFLSIEVIFAVKFLCCLRQSLPWRLLAAWGYLCCEVLLPEAISAVKSSCCYLKLALLLLETRSAVACTWNLLCCDINVMTKA